MSVPSGIHISLVLCTFSSVKKTVMCYKFSVLWLICNDCFNLYCHDKELISIILFRLQLIVMRVSLVQKL